MRIHWSLINGLWRRSVRLDRCFVLECCLRGASMRVGWCWGRQLWVLLLGRWWRCLRGMGSIGLAELPGAVWGSLSLWCGSWRLRMRS